MNINSSENRKLSFAPKIDVVMRYFLPVTAGIEINVWNTYKKLVKNGWDVTLHVTKDTYTEKNILSDNEIMDGIKVRRYPYRSLGFRPDIDWKSTNAVCLHNFDIFPHLWIMLKVYFLKLKGKKTFSLFVTPHGGFCPEWSVFGFISRNVKHIYTNTLGLILLNRTADGIRAVSPWEADEMIRIGVNHSLIQVVTNGLEDEAYMDVESLTSSEIKEKVLSIGSYIMDNSRIKPIKNVATIIRTLALLPTHINFIHIGTTQDIKYRESLLELAKSLGLENRVHFLGVVRGIDKYYLYKKALVFVHPALWEANANVVHEAWSQKLTTIVGDNTGMRAQVKHGVNGYLVEVHNEKTLSKLILDVISNKDSDLIKTFNEINLEYVNTHSWSDVGSRMGDFYLSRMENIFMPSLVKSDVLLGFNQQIDNIIKNKLTCYFISPHLDDAVYSAGSLIEHLSKHTKVNVVSVFTEANNHKTLSIRSFLRQCKFKSAIELFKTRRQEDIKVCESIGAKAIHLGFFDAPWRLKQVGKFRNFLSYVIPELKSVYPIHKLHIAKGKVSNDDSVTIENIRETLSKEIDASGNGNFVVFGPSAIGGHVDHVIVRNICKEMFPNPIFWADVPYVTEGQKPATNQMLGELASRPNSDGKMEMLKGYGSQFTAMFDGKKIDLLPELFYFSKPVNVKPKVSVGIPAYNEEGNIKNLLESLLSQKEINYELLEILVMSDGSSDKTVEKASSVLSNKVKVFDYADRLGGAKRQNSILKEFNGDILVMLDGDTLPQNQYYLTNMIAPFFEDSTIGMLSNRSEPLPAETFFERIINFSVNMKTEMLEGYNGGNNIYLCHGQSRAFSRKFTEKINWPAVTGEDAYSYLRLEEIGFKFYYQPKAVILYRSPQNFIDHVKQSSRFISSKKEFKNYYSNDYIKNSFKIPIGLIAKTIIKYFFKNPLLFTLYIIIYLLACVDSMLKNRAQAVWEPSTSSKTLVVKSKHNVQVKNSKAVTVSVGIPAYNEEANIGHLLQNLLTQKHDNHILKEIIVLSDASTDRTVEVARAVGSSLIRVIDSDVRIGAALIQNNITSLADGDILVLLDADVLPIDDNFINNIVEPMQSDGQIGLVGADTVAADPNTKLEGIIAYSHTIKKEIYTKINNGNNIYLCHGRARAFSKKLYKKIQWPDYAAEDAFSYLFCLKEGLQFQFAPNAKVLFRSPSNLKDYKKQSRRFLDARKHRKLEARDVNYHNPYQIPIPMILRVFIGSLLIHPIKTITYIGMHLYVRLFVRKTNIKARYDLVETSKKLI